MHLPQNLPNPNDQSPQHQAMRCTKLCIFLAVLASLTSPALWAAPADLDTSFNGGQFTIPVSPYQDEAIAVSMLGDGRVVTGGWSDTPYGSDELEHWAVVRRNADGTPDTTFGGGSGQVITPVGLPLPISGVISSQLISLVVQSDGKLLGTGYDVEDKLYLYRWNADGSPDTSYGTQGLFHRNSDAATMQDRSLALQKDGKAVMTSDANGEAIVLRATPAGMPDSTFQIDGLVGTPVGNLTAGAVTVQPDGKIVVAITVTGNKHSGVARLTNDGALDATFGSAGIAIIDHALGTVVDVAVQPNGDILVVSRFSNTESYVLRFDSHGKPDHTFNGDGNTDGRVQVPMWVTKMALLPTGKILLSGLNYTSPSPHYGTTIRVGRLNTDGSLDTSFTDSTGGSGIIDIAGPAGLYVKSWGLNLQSDGRFVVAGGNGKDFFLARFQGDALLLKPKPLTFASAAGVPVSTVEVSGVVTIKGLTAGAFVPITITQGSYSINGDPFVSKLGYVQNGDQVMVEQTSAAAAHTSVTTTLKVGGINTPESPWVVNGARVVATFTSTTL